MKDTCWDHALEVTAGGNGLVGHAGGVLLRKLADQCGLTAGLALAAPTARHHHERWDGSGYPDGLAGDAIPLGARVVGLVAVYDALRCRRPYRPALSHPRAVRLITTECEGQFDPTLLAAFTAAADQFDRIFQASGR